MDVKIHKRTVQPKTGQVATHMHGKAASKKQNTWNLAVMLSPVDDVG